MAQTGTVSSANEGGDNGDGGSIRYNASEDQVRELAKRLYGLTVTKLKELNGYEDANFHIFADSDCGNENIETVHSDGYVMKIVNREDSKRPDYVDAQSHLFFHLDSRIPGCCPLPVKNIDGKLSSVESFDGDSKDESKESVPKRHLVRLLTFLPGQIFHSIPQPDYDNFYAVGEFLGKIHRVFMEFSSSALDNPKPLWSIYDVPLLKDYTFAVRDPERRALANEVVQAFTETVPPHYPKLSKGVIHGDFNEQNTLVHAKKEGGDDTGVKYRITGVIDLGECANACHVFDIGMTIMYMMTCSKDLDSIEVGGHVLAGYLSRMTLSNLELDLLKTVVSARFVQSMALGEYYYTLDKDEYCLLTGKIGWGLLEKLWTMPNDSLKKRWFDIAETRRHSS